MLEVRKADDRGRANFGWLDSKHTFSFGSYYDENHMGFSALRVINDDTVTGGAGFGTHGHRDMEIISFVTQGVIEHKDSMGNVQVLPKGEFQLMSAGKGVYHSEYNGSKEDELKFLQIWIVPNETGGEPGYQQKYFGEQAGLTPVATPTGEKGTLRIKQNARLSQLILSDGQELSMAVTDLPRVYVHVVTGSLLINGVTLSPGDGVKIDQTSTVEMQNMGQEPLTALVFELP
jgi:redox-sensitive bicupin YhaK (pirin superfamily)